MRTHCLFEYTHESALPSDETGEIRTPDAVVRHFLEEYSSAGDRILDAFVGFGTTLKVAEQLDRVPYGIEYEPDRAAYIDERVITTGRIRQGSVFELEPSWLPPCECCFTSPPFMEQTDDRDPFQNYASESTYTDYLDDIERAFRRISTALVPDGTVIVDCANMKHNGNVTPLA